MAAGAESCDCQEEEESKIVRKELIVLQSFVFTTQFSPGCSAHEARGRSPRHHSKARMRPKKHVRNRRQFSPASFPPLFSLLPLTLSPRKHRKLSANLYQPLTLLCQDLHSRTRLCSTSFPASLPLHLFRLFTTSRAPADNSSSYSNLTCIRTLRSRVMNSTRRC